MCSDGLYSELQNTEILNIINKNIPSKIEATQKQLDLCVNELIDTANKNGGKDNVSVVMVVII